MKARRCSGALTLVGSLAGGRYYFLFMRPASPRSSSTSTTGQWSLCRETRQKRLPSWQSPPKSSRQQSDCRLRPALVVRPGGGVGDAVLYAWSAYFGQLHEKFGRSISIPPTLDYDVISPIFRYG